MQEVYLSHPSLDHPVIQACAQKHQYLRHLLCDYGDKLMAEGQEALG